MLKLIEQWRVIRQFEFGSMRCSLASCHVINNHSEKVPGCNLAFLDLEKAFNRVPKDVIRVGG